MKFKEIELEKLVVKKNVRLEPEDDLESLEASIEKYGILQPILVRPIAGGKYEIVSGHRRYAAMKARNEPTVPCMIDNEITDHDRVFLQLVENSQRKQMSAYEYVEVFEALKKKDPSMTAGKIAQLIGRSRNWVDKQYQAVKLAGVLVSDGEDAREMKNLRAGQIVGRAAARGLGVNGKRPARDISVACLDSTTLNVRCRDSRVLARVLEVIDELRDVIRHELGEAAGE